MSQVKGGQLDLSGINISKFATTRKPRPNVKQKFVIAGPEVVQEAKSCGFSKILFSVLSLCAILFLIFGFLNSSSSSSTYVENNSFKHLTTNLRKIIRMKCVHDSTTHCTTAYEGGEYVVNIKKCVVFDFNGIPFTDVFMDRQNNWHVPPSTDMTLVVNRACKDITATYDTEVKYLENYARKNSVGNLIKKIVWIPTKNCYTEFNLNIGKQSILQGTPANMITQKTFNNVVAFEYEVTGKVEGGISVSGKGCDVPIQIYSEKY
ncbi:MAG: hypothetical protein CMO44_01390 [Verrucomicrobiales bacterium]|nr:hypothetical protein [Verrucomicrobiales bacterium]